MTLPYYLYLVEDIYNRKGVGYKVHECEQVGLVAELFQITVINSR